MNFRATFLEAAIGLLLLAALFCGVGKPVSGLVCTLAAYVAGNLASKA